MHLNNILSSLPLLAIATGSSLGFVPRENHRKTCAVHPAGSESVDDATAVLEAFHECGHGGRVVFSNTTYHIKSVMNTTGLKDCQVDLYGTLLWGTNITYWLNHSLPVGYQNQSTAWVFGGENVRFNGHGYGTLNGNGQAWYDFVGDVSNYPGRPHALTVAGASKSVFEGLRFVQSQMWTLSVIHSDHLLFDSIYVNNTSSSGSAQNTDGGDTIASSHITFNNWTIDNGDDSLSTKANSTDILIANSTFHRGLGIAVGSIGQYNGIYETVERVRAENITYQGTLHAVYYKTWTGEQVGYPPNGGGGGLGHASDMTFNDLKVHDLQGPAVTISQCTSFSDESGNCTSSKFQIRDLSFSGISGSSSTDVVASLQCSAVKPCEHIEIDADSLDIAVNGTDVLAHEYLCGNVDDPIGFDCTGDVCVGSSATGGCSEHQMKDRTKALTR